MNFSLEAFAAALAEAVAGIVSPRYVVALSGGLDSTVALHALLAVSAAENLRAIHVDHGLHPDSGRWREHCRAMCNELGVPFTDAMVSIDPEAGEGPEDAARRARYDCLDRELCDDECLVTGHHADDQLETVLLQLLRGAGPAGLAAMPSLARFGAGWLCRPLLGFERRDLLDWAQGRGLAWLEDPSNREDGFDRNYLRLEVLPALRRRWPAAALNAVRSARHCGEAVELLGDLADADLDAVSDGARLDVERLTALSPARQRNVLRRWIRLNGLETPDSRRLEAILRDVIPARGDARPEVRWSGGAVRRYRGSLYALDGPALRCLDQPPLALRWPAGEPLDLGAGRGRLRLVPTAGPGLPPNLFEHGPLDVRSRRGGETIRPTGRTATRTLKKLLQEEGIPPWWRDHIPLIWQGDRLLCVADLWCASDACSPGPGRQRVIWEERPELS